MDRRIDADVAQTQLNEILDLATKNDERFIVDRDGEPAVVIMSVRDFIRTMAPPPSWLQDVWAELKLRGLETMTLDEINAEIATYRAEKAAARTSE